MVSLWDGSGIIGSERAVKFGLRRVESDRGRLGEVRFGLRWVKNVRLGQVRNKLS